MDERWQGAVHGALAGVLGASCMSVLRLVGRRQGLFDKTTPQAVEAWLMRRLHAVPPGGVTGHQALAEAIHLGYGLAWGVGWGVVQGGRRAGPGWGALYGLVQWGVGILGVLPAVGATAPPSRLRPQEHAVNVLAHLLYGGVLAFVSQELERQEEAHTARRTWLHFNRSVA